MTPTLTLKVVKQKYGYRAQVFDGDNLVVQCMDYQDTEEEAMKVAVKYLVPKYVLEDD